MTNDVDRLVRHIICECERHNGVASFIPAPFVAQMVPCSGYFSEAPCTLAVATGKPVQQWAAVALHELHHLQQWRDGSPAWYATQIEPEVDAGWLFFLWLRGFVELGVEQAERYADLTRRVELECERATARAMRVGEWDIGVDPEAYTRAANAYVFFYTLAARDRVWCKPGSIGMSNKRLMDVAPAKFLRPEQYAQLDEWPELVGELHRCAVSLVGRELSELYPAWARK